MSTMPEREKKELVRVAVNGLREEYVIEQGGRRVKKEKPKEKIPLRMSVNVKPIGYSFN